MSRTEDDGSGSAAVNDDRDPSADPTQDPVSGGGGLIDVRGAQGVQLGGGNIQHNYYGVDVLEISSPYRGLRAFAEGNEAVYFGRDEAVSTVLERMSKQVDASGLLVVSGVSGCGKSSLLAAGVQPRIRAGELARGTKPWPILMFTPTANPCNELAERVAPLAGSDAVTVLRNLTDDPTSFAHTARQAALDPDSPSASPDSTSPRRIVLVVDQFEQLFSQCGSEAQRRAFITALHAAAIGHPDATPAALVVLVVRADFEAHCAEYPELKTAAQDRYLLTAMTESQLRLAITEPAKRVGSGVDDQLVEQLLHEMLDPSSSPNGAQRSAVSGAAALPLLSHALDQTWRTSKGTPLRLADYERTGGIEGAVAQTAQSAYNGLSSNQRQVAQQIFTRLVATTTDGKDTANQVARADLAKGKNAANTEDVNAVLETFAGKRLLTLDADTVEISHEVLLTAWPRLRDEWLAEIDADRIVRSHLSAAAAEWVGHDRKASSLYHGKRRKIAIATAARIRTDPRHPALTNDENDFLDASTRAHRRRVRARQVLIAALTVLTVAASTLAAVAVYRGRQVSARLTAANAETLARESRSRAPTDIATAAQLALAAWRANPSAMTRTALANAYLPLRSLDAEIVNPIGEPIKGFRIKGDTALLTSPNRMVVLTGVSGPVPQSWEVPDASADTALDLSPDGRWLAEMTKDGTIRIRDVLTRSTPETIATGQKPDSVLVFGPDSKRIAWLTDSGRQGEVELRSCDLTSCAAKPPDPRPLPAPRTIYGIWLTPDLNQVLVRYGDRHSNDSQVVLRSTVDGSELAIMAPGALVTRDGAAVVSCAPAPENDPSAKATVTITPVGDAAPPIRINSVGATCVRLGVSNDGGWLVEQNSPGSQGHATASLQLTDLRTGQGRQVTVPSGPDRTTDVSEMTTLGVSTAGGQPSVLFAHGTSLLRLRTEPAMIGPGKAPLRKLADDGRYLTWSTPDLSWSSRGTVSVEERSTGRTIATLSDLDPFTGDALVGNSLWLFRPTGNQRQVDRYEVSPFRKITTFALPAPHPEVQGFGAISPVGDTTMLLVVSGGALSAVDSMNGRILAPPVSLPRPNELLLGGGGVALIPRPGHAGQVALSGWRDTQIWDALSGRTIATLPVSGTGQGSMAFDPSGQRIAVVTRDKTVELWDIDSATRLRPPIPAADGQKLVGFDADGYLDVLTGDIQDRLSFVDLDQGEEAGSMDVGLGVDDTSIFGDPVAPVISIGEVLPYELPVTAQGWHDRLCAAANRAYTAAELAILPPGTDPDPPCS